MMNLFEAAVVVARRDFIASVYTRSFVFFLLAPLFVFGVSLFAGQLAGSQERRASQPAVAVVTDTETARAYTDAHAQLLTRMSETSLPRLRVVAPAENVGAQARALLADEEGGYTAVLSGTLQRPVVTGPARVDEGIGRRIGLVVEHAQRNAALTAAGAPTSFPAAERVITDQAAGNLQSIRRGIAMGTQGLIFGITVLLATLLLSNLTEEKTNKVIEVLAASIPLDAIFLGKLIAMLGVSLVGLSVWGGMLGIGYFFLQVIQDWMTLPQVAPAVGWAPFILLLVFYYTTNYMLLGSLFLGIGGQASNIREIQTLSMPVTMLQVIVFFLAAATVGREPDTLTWFATIFPFSSPLVMVSNAATSPLLWPHLVALLWQAIWVVLIIRISARLFKRTVLKSGSKLSFMQELRFWRA